MRTLGAFVLVLMFQGFQCDEVLTPDDVHPVWVGKLIEEYSAAPVGNPPQSIWRYEYKGNTVYYVPPQCCDFYSDLYNIDGVIIAHPDGGIAGGGDGRSPDFFQKRTHEMLVWQDNRRPGKQ